MEDRILIQRIKQGDKDSFERLVRKYYQDIFSYCCRRIGNREDAEDLTQEVFLKLVKAIYRYQFTGKFSNFLFTIAVNSCNDHLRRRSNEQDGRDVELLPSEEGSAQDSLLWREELDKLHQALHGLRDEERETLILYYFHQFKAREVAAITGVPLATAKSRIRRGLQHLRELYEKEEEK